MFKTLLNTSSLFLLLTALPLSAQEVTLPHETLNHKILTLNAEMTLAENSQLSDGVMLITHGTLAHNKMDVISTFQNLLADAGINTLAINLSLGINNRHGMYDCKVPHQHKHTDAIEEINAWLSWLQQQGAGNITLMGHSRGGNQTAWFSDSHPEQSIKAQILLAPATWSEKAELDNYQKRYEKSLSAILSDAQRAQPDTWIEHVDFIYCADSRVKADSFVDYYQANPKFNTPYLLKRTAIPTLVISGSEDKTVSDLPEMMADVSNPLVQHAEIEGADHYFMDLYADDAVESIIEFLDNQK
jgi:pimeloyl-ACP methyl ester carboxylesterase